MNIEYVKKTVTPILKQYDVTRAAIFGSVARGEDRPDSDVDLLIDVSHPLGLLRLAKLQYTLEDALHTNVDVVKFSALKPALRENVFRDAIVIYG